MLLPELQRDRHDPHPVLAGSKISRDCLSMMTLVAGIQSSVKLLTSLPKYSGQAQPWRCRRRGDLGLVAAAEPHETERAPPLVLCSVITRDRVRRYSARIDPSWCKTWSRVPVVCYGGGGRLGRLPAAAARHAARGALGALRAGRQRNLGLDEREETVVDARICIALRGSNRQGREAFLGLARL